MNCQCNSMLCQMKRDINEDPVYVLGASLFSGFLFATWSWGILYLLVFLILWEIGYYLYCRNFRDINDYDITIRIGIAAGAIMGFLIGRCITKNDDHEKSIVEFWETVHKYTGYKHNK